MNSPKGISNNCLENCCRYQSGVICPSFGRTCLLRHKINNRYIEFNRVRDIAKRRPAVWMMLKDEIFLRCPVCGGMNAVHASEVDRLGRVRTYPQGRLCTTCPQCKSHFYACLKGWKG